MLPIIFSKALRNLFLPGILKLFFFCVLLYMALAAILGVAVTFVVTSLVESLPWQGWIVHILGGTGGMLVAWFLFPLLYPILVSFFDDQMAEIIEREDYPYIPPATPPFWPTFWQDVLFSLKAIGLNLLCLPFYFIPLLGVVLYYGMNGYLLGMQFFRMAAGRRVDQKTVQEMQKRAFSSIVLVGVSISFCATIPFLNLAVPMFGVALMLHLFHTLRGNEIKTLPPA